MTTCAIYCRISRDRIGAGLGVERQEAECRELAAKLGLTVTMLLVDNDLSAYTGKPRPAYRKLLAAIAAGEVQVVIAWHTDRLHRSPTELEDYIATCEQRGVPTHTAKAGPIDLATPSGRLVARQLGAVARYEVEHAIERQQAAKQQAAVAGRWAGGRRPYGYDADGMTVRADEAQIVAETTDNILLGASLRAETARINQAGALTSTGRPWSPSELRKVLLRPRNAGLREHRGEIIGEAQWPAIVTPEKWRALGAILTDPSRRTSPGAARRWLLSGIARCQVCGSALIVTTTAAPRSTSAKSYTCRQAKHVVRNAGELERYISAVMVARLRRPDALDLLQPARPEVDLAGLAAEEAELQRRKDDLARDLTMDERTLALRSAALQERIEQIQATRAEAARGSLFAGVVDAEDVAAAWKALPLDRRRTLIDALMTITVHRTSKGRPKGWRAGQPYFRPDGIDIDWRN